MKVTIIIPYKEDRGWLQEAIKSVPKDVQLILSQGNGNWPQNFNKALGQAEGDYIKYLHEDDMLTEHCIDDSLQTFKNTNADFIHGMAYEIYMNVGRKVGMYIPKIATPTLDDLLHHNVLHSATLMYKRSIFDKIGGFNESPDIYSFEEFEFNIRCLKAGFKLGYCDKPLAYYRRHSEQCIRTCDIEQRKINRLNLINSYL
jgi:GT2 family glycosyltransferase